MNLRKRTAELLERDFYNDRPSRIVNLFLILLISLNVIAIFLETVDSVYLQHRQAFLYFEIFSVLVFTVEYLARVWSSIDLEEADEASPIMGRLRYMLTPIALVDLLAILPFYLSLYVTIDLRFLRVLRLLRLFKLTRYSPALGALLDVVQKEADALLAALVVLLMMLVISAGLIGIGMIALPAAILASGFAENIRGRKQKYNHYVQTFLKDGILDEHERWKLEELRKELGLDSDEALQLLDSIMHQARDAVPGECPHCGKRLR